MAMLYLRNKPIGAISESGGGTCQALYNEIASIHTMSVMIMDSLGNILERNFYDESMYKTDDEPTE